MSGPESDAIGRLVAAPTLKKLAQELQRAWAASASGTIGEQRRGRGGGGVC